MKIRENIPISELTTMRLGGAARYVIEIETPEEIPEAYNFAATKNLPTFILGAGANTIGHDEGYDGVILINKIQGVSLDGTTLRAMGGEEWDKVVELACSHNLTGIEALSKIPGTAGAAPVQNIGAYGQDIAAVFELAEVYDAKDKKFTTLTKADMQFSYRKSILNSNARGRYFVIAVTLKLSAGEMHPPFYNSLERYIAEHHETDFSPMSIRRMVSAIRADKLPDPAFIASSGSFFKNVYLSEQEIIKAENQGIPVYHSQNGCKINSGWLIQQAGLSGKIFHGMRVSPKAALILINESATSYNDLAAARTEIINTVYDKFGYRLEQEPVELV